MYLFIKKTLCFAVFLSFNLIINSQNTTSSLDSLARKNFSELTDLFYESKPDSLKAIMYADVLYLKALIEKATMPMIGAKYLLADIKKNKSIYLNYCDSLIEITKKKSSKNFPAAFYINKAKHYFQRGENSASLKELVSVNNCFKKNKNDSLKFLAIIMLANIKNSVREYKESLILFKKSYNYALKNNSLKNDYFSTLPLNIALAYRNMNKIDSAYLYNNIAINLYEKINDSISLGYSFYILGGLQYKKKEYQKSIKSYKKAIPSIISDENYNVLTNIYSIIGRLYDSIGDKKKTLEYHLKADSLNNLKKMSSPGLDKTYQFLYNYNKQNNNLNKQLTYLNKLLKIKEFKLKEKNKITKTFTEEYDIPNLLAEKKIIIDKLENQVQKSRRNKLIYISLLFFTSLLIIYQFRKRNIYKKRFLALVNQNNFVRIKHLHHPNKKDTFTSKHNLPNNIVSSILKKLEAFEKKEDFLQSDNSLQSLAGKFNTNTNYLSKVINQHKNTTFSNYINNLRIDYTVDKLKTNSLLRKYTIKAIAIEVGFKNAESFSKAFYKFTEIKPSYFIKELEKNNTID